MILLFIFTVTVSAAASMQRQPPSPPLKVPQKKGKSVKQPRNTIISPQRSSFDSSTATVIVFKYVRNYIPDLLGQSRG